MDIEQIIFLVREKKFELEIKGIRPEIVVCHPKTESKLLNSLYSYQSSYIYVDAERSVINRLCGLRLITSLYVQEDEIIVK